ncbi:MAG TPA: hypothetical protein VNA04_15110 [Thermoanaerobaculia bacterium]|nr:hypothetical protein [Thermoanaerobaculia bacterium]
MKRLSSAMAAALLLVAGLVQAGEGHDHDHGPVDLGKLGKVTFRVSCGGAQKDFSRAVAMMHSFWYYEAEKAFQQIARAHPRCAMAHWGVAMANYHPLWAPPAAGELGRGRAAAEKAMAMKGGNARERGYIEAIHAFYADADKVDHATRASRYEEGMAKVAAANPRDREAQIFNALAILGTASPNDKTYAKQKKAAEILNKILPAQPEHPGVAHYIIHSYDYPQLASMALQAARTYAKIAPGSPHALHMPSHIFTRLGLWDESISSNTASAEKARRYIRQLNPNLVSFDELHAIDYLVYAHLQQADDEKAKALVDQMIAAEKPVLDLNNFAAAYAYAAAPVRYALERRMWSDAARLQLRPSSFPWKTFPAMEAIHHFGRAIGGARSGDLNTAKAALDRLTEIQSALADQKNRYWAEQVEIQRLAAQAWLAHAAGLRDEGLRLMRAAADLEDTTEKHPVTPGPAIPARELLAEMLLEEGKAAEALTEAELVLTVSPGRYNAVSLAARAAEQAGDRQKAEEHYRALVGLAKGGATRPELQKARTFVAGR